MAAITLSAPPIAIQQPQSDDKIKAVPLRFWQVVLLPLLIMLMSGRRAQFDLSLKLYHEAKEEAGKLRAIKSEVTKEARLYEQIIVTRWSALGNMHRPGSIYDGPERRQREKKPQYVKFESIFAGSETIFYKILTRKRAGPLGLFGQKNALPYNVRVVDLISEQTLNELSYACHRRVRTVSEKPQLGVWVLVDRLEGMDGLPNFIRFREILPAYPVEDIDDAPLLLGVGQHLRYREASLAMYPHVLVGGSTGSGKSNMINNLICQLARFAEPEKLRIVLIDLKRMEFSFYRELPHLRGEIVYTPERACEILKELMQEALTRAEMLSGKAKDLRAWNARFPRRPSRGSFAS